MKYIIAFTDGSCNVKNRLGGCGALIQFKDNSQVLDEIQISLGFKGTTVSRMELRAIIETLKSITTKDKYSVIIVSDSEYTVNSINKRWVFRWEEESWQNRKNKDLWSNFLKEYRKFPEHLLRFIHTRGHGKGIQCFRQGNSIADFLADYKQFNEYINDEEII